MNILKAELAVAGMCNIEHLHSLDAEIKAALYVK